MSRMEGKASIFVVICVCFLSILAAMLWAEESDRMEVYHQYLKFPSLVKSGSVQPHWFYDGSSFWFAESMPENTVIYKVDPKLNTKESLFGVERLRQALTPLLGHEPSFNGLPFQEFTFIPGQNAVKFNVEGKDFILQLDDYKIKSVPSRSAEEQQRWIPRVVQKGFPAGRADALEVLSPDRRWFLGVKDYNLYLRSTYDGRAEWLTTDGIKGYAWVIQPTETRSIEKAKWSPNSLKVAAVKVDSQKIGRVPLIHWLRQREEVEWIPYVRVGEAMRQSEIFVIDILSKRKILIDTGAEPDQHLAVLGWKPDSTEIIVGRMNRVMNVLELLAADVETGSSRVILTETQKTFVGGLYSPYGALTRLEDGEKFLWISERDSWAHLYLYDLNGNLIKRLTKGAFPVLRVVGVDEERGWVYFIAHAEERLYDTHLYRVSFEGTDFRRLTEAAGQHSPQLSPSKEFFLDTHSSHDRPPSTELRRADGSLLKTLSKANVDALQDLKWRPPEEFVVKAADGKTDLYGIMYKPYDFDTNKKYPVIDNIYGGPQMTWVPRTFVTKTHGGVLKGTMAQAIAQLGYIVFMVDARGTPERGKAYHDVVFRNVGRNEIPDHVAALKNLAADRPYMDLSRVGIFGISYGGYFTIRAMLLAPDVYQVGVSSNPVTDLYQRRAPIEPYMGRPQDNPEGYEYGSSVRMAHKLKGKLLLIHATNDVNAPLNATMKLAESFIRAGKPFDLLIMPGQDHIFNGLSGSGFRYWLDAVPRYFLEHLPPTK